MEKTGSSTVAPTLLGLGKDDRYQSRLSSLISEVIAPYLKVSNNASNGISGSNEIGVNDQQPEDILEPEINLLSRIVFGIIMAREGKSLGLEYVGLQYKNRSSIKFRLFILLYIIRPYALDRVKRKGFDELKNARISLLPSIFERNETIIRNRDDLRGIDRRRLFEESRRRMLERAQTIQSSNENDPNRSSTIGRNQSVNSTCKMKSKTTSNKLGSIKGRVLEILEQMALACDLQPPRPHHVPTQNIGEDGNQNSQNHQLTNTKLKRLGSMFKWLIHLNLALFYVNAKYPTIIHRVLGLRIDGRNDKTKLKAELADYSPIGLMIIIQTLGKLTQALLEMTVKSYYQSFQSKLPNRNIERNQLIQTKVPAHVEELQSISTVDRDICGICMTERNHPAASVKCGHVLCWDCLHHWIATVRQECPICRTSCTHQQIIALH